MKNSATPYKRYLILFAAVAFVFTALLVPPAMAKDKDSDKIKKGDLKTKKATIFELVQNIDGFQALAGAVLYAQGVADLVPLLDDKKQKLTVFAPTNDAFEMFLDLEPGALKGMSPEMIALALGGLVGDPNAVLAVLLKHVITDEKFKVSELLVLKEATAADEDTTLMFGVGTSLMNGGGKVNNSFIVLSDLEAKNGNIHGIDHVIEDMME
jgi:uncharacterized surface protein with fasciclin (FAS1) repeats